MHEEDKLFIMKKCNPPLWVRFCFIFCKVRVSMGDSYNDVRVVLYYKKFRDNIFIIREQVLYGDIENKPKLPKWYTDNNNVN